MQSGSWVTLACSFYQPRARCLVVSSGPHPGDSQRSKPGKGTVLFGWNWPGSLCCQSRVVRSGLWKHTAQVQIQLPYLLACDRGPVAFLHLDNPLVGVVACEALGAGLGTWKALDDCWLSLLFPGFMVGKRSILCVISQQTKVSWQKGNRYPCF